MEEEGDPEVNAPEPAPPPPFLEVKCKSSGRTCRFAVGTKAGFAVSVMNRRLKGGGPPSWYVEAVKDGEEPVCFGPDAPLLDYGSGWNLQTFNDSDLAAPGRSGRVGPVPKSVDSSHPAKALPKPISYLYIAKILFAFILIFVLGAILTLALESLPMLITFLNELM